jgi:hypothetical protein
MLLKIAQKQCVQKPISVNFYKIVSNTVWDSDHASTMRELYIQGVSKNKKIRQFNEIQLAPRQISVFYSIRVFYSCLKVRCGLVKGTDWLS